MRSDLRSITNKERKLAGDIYCDYCKPKKVNAVWRKKGLGASHELKDFACFEHKHWIRKSDNYYTEAGYQTWLNI